MASGSHHIFLRGQHVVQTVLGVYGAIVSYNAIVRLRKYESTSEKLAEWSSEAANQLHKTRTTQASGAVAILASLVSSVTLSAFDSYLPRWARFSLSPAMLLTVLLAKNHMSRYWAPKDGKTVGTRVPLPNMGEYNEAQLKTQDLLKVLEYLEYSWVASSIFDGIIGY